MKKALMIAALTLTLSGCSTLKDLISSRWDPNEAATITDARYIAAKTDCKDPADIIKIQERIDWLVLYTDSKGSRDINKMLAPVKESLDPLVERAQKKEMTVIFCQLKMKIIRAELDAVARGTNARLTP